MTNKFERYQLEIPELVHQAISLAEELGFPLMPEGRQAFKVRPRHAPRRLAGS